MRYIILVLILFPIRIGISQEEKPLKNDIAIYYGFQLNNFGTFIPGIEFRRAVHDNWRIKINAHMNRYWGEQRTLSRIAFPISDTAIMQRQQNQTYHIGKTYKLGVDFTKFEQFSIGAEFIFGKSYGTSNITDGAFYKDSTSGEYSLYSEELTNKYHGPYPFSPAGIITSGRRYAEIGRINYLVIGIGLTAEAKWPIGKHFEVALQYSPELIHFKVRDFTDDFELDQFYTKQMKDRTTVYHLANLFIRFKF